MSMDKTKLGAKIYSSQNEKNAQVEIVKLFRKCPIPDDEILSNLGLFLTSKNLSRIFFMDHIYKQIVNVPGVIMEMGTRWGQNMSLFMTLRSIYEPYHRHRKVIGFDTFEGFPSISKQDGNSDLMEKGNLKVGEDYMAYLASLMWQKERNEPLSHIQKYNIVKGDAVQKLQEYLKINPQTIIALMYFDFDLYEPTKKCLEMVASYLTKGSVLAFDELNDGDSPGETIALKEIIGLRNVKLRRLPNVARSSYLIIE